MNFLSEFGANLGNRNTAMIIGFLTGYVVGVSKLSKNSALIGIVFGLVLAITVGLINSFIDFLFPEEITISISLKSVFKAVFTIVLLAVFFFMVSSLISN